MSIDWDKLGAFVQAVGVPFACLILFVGPFVWIFARIFVKYGPAIAQSHISFMESAERTQEKNAETLSRLESSVTSKHEDHKATHEAIGLVAQAGISMLDSDHQEARTKLKRVEHVLARKVDAK